MICGMTILPLPFEIQGISLQSEIVHEKGALFKCNTASSRKSSSEWMSLK